MLLTNNELGSQNIEEFLNLLEEYSKFEVGYFMEIGSLYGWSLQHFIYYSKYNSTGISIDLPVRKFVGENDHRVEKQEHNSSVA